MGRTSDARERLVAAMAELVHGSGYSAVSVDDVCAAAKVKKGSFYYFFSSKRELMLAVLDMRWGMARDHFLGAVFAPEIPPLERIERFFAAVGEMEKMNKRKGGRVRGCPFGNVAAEMGASEPVLGERVDAAFCGLGNVIREALDEAVQRGTIDALVDTRQAAEAIVAYFEGVSLLAKARNDPSLMGELGALATRLALTEAAQRSAATGKSGKKIGPRRSPRPDRARKKQSTR